MQSRQGSPRVTRITKFDDLDVVEMVFDSLGVSVWFQRVCVCQRVCLCGL